jgi:4'-phosphopantetheinyl transferase EntD
VSLIAHPTQEVGIDIEQLSNRICGLKNRFLHWEELLHVNSSQEAVHLLLYWGAKEVLFKMMDEENVDFARQLRIFPFTLETKGVFFGKEMRTKQQENYTFAYWVRDSFILVWCVN